jgi:hypothetical protein
MRFLIHELIRLAALALFAAGLAGLLAEPVSWKTGMDYFTGDDRALVPGLSVERCQQLPHLHPGTRTCADALVEDHFGELVEAGLLATLAGGAVLLWTGRRRRAASGRAEQVLRALLAGCGAVAFAALAAFSLPAGLAGRAGLLPGSGRMLLEGGVAALAAAVQAAELVAAVRGLTDARS